MARELAPAGLRSGPKILGALRTGAPARSSGSKLPRHSKPAPTFFCVALQTYISPGTLACPRASSRLISPALTNAFKLISSVFIPNAPPV